MTRSLLRRLRRARRVVRPAFAWLLILAVASASLPADLLPSWLPAPRSAAAETLGSPRYVSAAVMPNGQVGLLFLNVSGSSSEIRFMRYTTEHELASSVQLSTAGPSYAQLAVLGSTVVAAYVDTRSPNVGKMIFRTSTDSGATWASESNPFGTETFDSTTFAPRVVASHSGTTLYMFTASSGNRPQYRSTTNLTTWSSAAAAGDTSMRVANGNNCGNAGDECYRAHAFGFMETATTGTWIYISKSDSGYGQSGRGTQVGTLGGSWSSQVDHGGSGGLSGGGESTATTFLDRDGNVYYIRAGEHGESLYWKKSTDAGATWGGRTYAYSDTVANYTTAAPVGLYVPGYSLGEYIWYAGFGGSEDTMRVVPLWTGPTLYARSGTVRMFGSKGGDFDPASAHPHNFGDPVASLGGGGYTTTQTDLAVKGRLLPFAFTRTYNSAAPRTGSALGPGWRHSYEWSVIENGSHVTVIRGTGQQDMFEAAGGGAYTAPLGVFDKLVKNSDGSFTLTTRDQVQYEFEQAVAPYSTLVSAASPTAYWRLGETSGTSAADASGHSLSGTYSGTYTLGGVGALYADTNHAVTFGGGYVDMGSPSSLNVTGTALTVEFWAKGTPGTYNYLVSHTDGSSQGYAVYTGGDAQYHFYVGRSGGLHVSGSVTGVWDGAWHHFANVYDGVQLKIYVDGILRLGEAETGSISSYTGNLRAAGYNGGGFTFSGSLDEVAVYASALSASDVGEHALANPPSARVLSEIHEPAGNSVALSYGSYGLRSITDTVGRTVSLTYDATRALRSVTDSTGRAVRYQYDTTGRLTGVWNAEATSSAAYQTTVQADSPVAYWRLGESSGTSAADLGPNTLTGTYSGGFTLGATGASRTSGTAVTLNGSTGKVTAGVTGIPTGNAARTIEAWVKPSGNGGTVFASNASSGQRFELFTAYISGNWYLFSDGVNDSNTVQMSGLEVPPANTWSHIAFVYEGEATSSWRYYLNGDFVKGGTFPTAINTSSATSVTIGERLDYSLPFNGTVQDVAVYNTALTGAQVASHYWAALLDVQL